MQKTKHSFENKISCCRFYYVWWEPFKRVHGLMEAVYVGTSICTCCPLSLPGNLVADVAALSCLWSGSLSYLPTTTESNYVRSLYLCLRHVWERSCVHPHSTFSVSAPRRQMWDQNCSATLNYICWQSCSLAAGCQGPVPPLETDVGSNLLAHTCISFPNLMDC